MTAPRVSEEEIESLILVELRHRDRRCAKTLRLLMEERSALEARLVSKDAEIERLRGYLDTPKGTSP